MSTDPVLKRLEEIQAQGARNFDGWLGHRPNVELLYQCVRALWEANQFYADEDNYLHGPKGHANVPWFGKDSFVGGDMGEAARHAAEEVRKLLGVKS